MYYPTIKTPISYRYMSDPQDAPPLGWCPRCGREIYAIGENLCQDCREGDPDG